MGWWFKIIFLATLFALGDFVTEGWISDTVLDNFGDDRGEFIGSSAACLWGVSTYPPVVEILGMQFPAPSSDDVLYALFGTVILIALIHLFTSWNPTIFDSIFIFICTWLSIKLLALFFILSIDGCKEIAIESYFALQPLQIVGMIVAPFVVLKFVFSRLLK